MPKKLPTKTPPISQPVKTPTVRVPVRAKKTPTAHSFSFWLWVILSGGFLLRLYNLTAIALWHNEAVSYFYTRASWPQFLHYLRLEGKAPIYYGLLKIWTWIFGTSVFNLRLLSVIFATLAIYLAYRLLEKLFNDEKISVLGSALIGLSPFLIQYSQTAQDFSILLCFSLWSSYLLLAAINSDSRRDWIWYSLAIIGGTFTNFWFLALILAQLIYYFRQKTARHGIPAFGFALFTTLILLPPLMNFFKQITFNQLSFWGGLETFWQLLFGGFGTNRIIVSTSAILLFTGLVFFYRRTSTRRLLLSLLCFLPFLVGFWLTSRGELDLNPLLIITSVFLLLISAKILHSIPDHTVRQVSMFVLLGLTVIIFFKNWEDLGVKNLFFTRHENRKPGMLAASRYINDLARPSDKIYAGTPYVYFSLSYYNQTEAPAFLYAPSILSNYVGRNLITSGNIAIDFSGARTNDTAWIVWSRGFGGMKPNIPGNWEIIAEKYYPDAPDFKGMTVVSEYHVN